MCFGSREGNGKLVGLERLTFLGLKFAIAKVVDVKFRKLVRMQRGRQRTMTSTQGGGTIIRQQNSGIRGIRKSRKSDEAAARRQEEKKPTSVLKSMETRHKRSELLCPKQNKIDRAQNNGVAQIPIRYSRVEDRP